MSTEDEKEKEKEKEPPLLFTRKEAARYLSVREGTLRAWASTKRYPLSYIKLGKHIQYRKEDLDAFIDSRRVNNSGSALSSLGFHKKE